MSWCWLSSGDASASKAASALNTWLWHSPVFAAAASRLVIQHHTATDAAEAQELMQGEATTPAAAKQVQASMHSVLRVAMRPLLAAQRAALDTTEPMGVHLLAADTVCRAVPALLTAPGLVDALPPELRRQLCASAGLDRCCRWLQLLLSSAQQPVESPGMRGGEATLSSRASGSSGTALTAEDAASGMRNLALLTLPDAPFTVSRVGHKSSACQQLAVRLKK